MTKIRCIRTIYSWTMGTGKLNIPLKIGICERIEFCMNFILEKKNNEIRVWWKFSFELLLKKKIIQFQGFDLFSMSAFYHHFFRRFYCWLIWTLTQIIMKTTSKVRTYFIASFDEPLVVNKCVKLDCYQENGCLFHFGLDKTIVKEVCERDPLDSFSSLFTKLLISYKDNH